MQALLKKVNCLPQKSGVYLFKDQQGQIVYIGKAISLRNRVSSYFSQSNSHSIKITRMIKNIHDLEYVLTNSEMEALLLENMLVKKYKPFYNTQLKDDKSYPYIYIGTLSPFPSIHLVRKSRKEIKKQGRYFGPFVDVEVAKNTVKRLREIFKIRNCSLKKFNQRKTCLDYQLGLCSGPCEEKINQESYANLIKQCSLLLSGKQKKLLSNLRNEMKVSAQLLHFEQAAKIRDTIRMIENVVDQEKTSQSYQKNLQHYLNTRFRCHFSLDKTIEKLQEYLLLPQKPKYIEAFDISNIHGQVAVGSMVVFISGMPARKKYRHYKIKTIKGINDYAMMEEVLFRHYRRCVEEGSSLPDLLLLDGGKGQLNVGIKVAKELNIKLNIIALAKKEEEIFQPERNEPVLLPKNSDVFYLVQRIRDEAHRFAVNYHKKLRSQYLKKSVLDFVPGIGEKRKALLLKRFNHIDDIRNASIDELVEIDGIGKVMAEKIKEILKIRGSIHDY